MYLPHEIHPLRSTVGFMTERTKIANSSLSECRFFTRRSRRSRDSLSRRSEPLEVAYVASASSHLRT